MRIWAISDLHLRGIDVLSSKHGSQLPEANPEADVLVIAGDLANGNINHTLRWLRDEVPSMPVVCVLGNHDHYGTDLVANLGMARAVARQLDIHLLENAAVEIGGTRFLGTTLWTDYELYVHPHRPPAESADLEWYMAMAANGLNDHRQIWLDIEDAFSRRRFTPEDALEIHRRSRAWLETELAKPFAGRTVVVTHHAPHPGSVSSQFQGDPVTPAFVSDLSGLINCRQPDLWIHGHTHASFDYHVGRTRVLCNPHGYGVENDGGYRPDLVVEM